ncbi:MAG: succinate dehydrogenase, cytochrome b556 subunit [Gammaproteobacteria bacterium]|jgi:succinate dehydrogenase / fumarate reductase cytochrome b subunit
MRPRPLSPHLGVYRFMYTMATSIAHRITGVVLSVGLVVLVGWLYAAASSADTYARASALLSSGFMKLLLAGWMLAFCYHLCNGIRHLNWDLGRGLEKAEARRSATLVVAVTVVLAAAFIYAAFFAGVPR